jgi:type VI secretion system protein ImpL
VDGVPPALDAAMASLAALSSMLQTVTANPDAEQAIKEQGGLAELTGAVANQAAVLPPPLDEWLAGIAGDTTAITEKAVVSKLNAIWKADVLPLCKAALDNRYPFDTGSRVDVNTEDFARIFGPGGLIDSFTNDHLLPYVDTTAQPWRWRADLGLDDSALASIERARHIRDALFPGGAGPVMAFRLQPTDLSPNATRVNLNLDGQPLAYFNSAALPVQMTWPGKDGTGVITLAFQPVDGSPEVMTSEQGSWAWLRMLRGGRLQATAQPDVFKLRLAAGGFHADFDLLANSVDNPMNLEMFAQFTCPEGL